MVHFGGSLQVLHAIVNREPGLIDLPVLSLCEGEGEKEIS